MPLSEDDTLLLIMAQEELLKYADAKEMVGILNGAYIISDDEMERIINMNNFVSRQEGVRLMINIYHKKAHSLEALIQALRHDLKPFVADRLQPDTPMLPPPSTAGGGDVVAVAPAQPPALQPQDSGFAPYEAMSVPSLRPNWVEMPDIDEQLVLALCQMATKPSGIVLLTGPPGFGKTALCSHVIRRHCERLFGRGRDQYYRVLWLDVRPSITPLAFLAMLHSKLKQASEFDDVPQADNQVFGPAVPWASSGKGQSGQVGEEALLEIVDLLLKRYYPRTLFIIDGLNSELYIEKLILPLKRRFLIITQSYVHFKYVSHDYDIHVRHIALTEGLSESQCLQLFANTLAQPVDQLPRQALDVARLCRGHPFMINLFAALLKTNHDPGRWLHYLDALKAHELHVIDRRPRSKHKTKNDTFVALAQLAADELPDDVKEPFAQLAVFPVGTIIPDSVLALIWSDNPRWVKRLIDVQDTMDELCDRSLAQLVHTQDNRGSDRMLQRRWYSLHPMIHIFIKRYVCRRPARNVVTKKLIAGLDSALAKQDDSFACRQTLERFWAVNIGYLLFKAGGSASDLDAAAYYLDLSKLTVRLQHYDAGCLINEYMIFASRAVSSIVSKHTLDYVGFLRRNARALQTCLYTGAADAQKQSDAEPAKLVIQLALREDSASVVHVHAQQLRRKQTDTTYYFEPQLIASFTDCALHCGTPGNALVAYVDPGYTLALAGTTSHDIHIVDGYSGSRLCQCHMPAPAKCLAVAKGHVLVGLQQCHDDDNLPAMLLYSVEPDVLQRAHDLPEVDVADLALADDDASCGKTPSPVTRHLCGPMHDVCLPGPGTSVMAGGDSTAMLDKMLTVSTNADLPSPIGTPREGPVERVIYLQSPTTTCPSGVRQAVYKCAMDPGATWAAGVTDDAVHCWHLANYTVGEADAAKCNFGTTVTSHQSVPMPAGTGRVLCAAFGSPALLLLITDCGQLLSMALDKEPTLNRQPLPNLQRKQQLSHACYAPVARQILALVDGCLHVWSLDTTSSSPRLSALYTHDVVHSSVGQQLRALHASDDGRYVAAACADFSVLLLSQQSPSTSSSSSSPSLCCTSLLAHTAAVDQVWDVERIGAQQVGSRQDLIVEDALVLDDKLWLLALTDDRHRAQLYHHHAWQSQFHAAACFELAAGPDEGRIAVGRLAPGGRLLLAFDSGDVKVYRMADAELVSECRVFVCRQPVQLALSVCADQLAALDRDGRVAVTAPLNGQADGGLRSLDMSGVKGRLANLQFTALPHTVIATNSVGQILVWHASRTHQLAEYWDASMTSPIRHVQLGSSESGCIQHDQLLAIAQHNAVKLLSLVWCDDEADVDCVAERKSSLLSLRLLHTIRLADASPVALAFSPDNTEFTYAVDNGQLHTLHVSYDIERASFAHSHLRSVDAGPVAGSGSVRVTHVLQPPLLLSVTPGLKLWQSTTAASPCLQTYPMRGADVRFVRALPITVQERDGQQTQAAAIVVVVDALNDLHILKLNALDATS